MSGYCAVGSFDIATAPAIVIRMAMTIATIGRRMKNSAMGLLLPVFPAGAAAGSGVLEASFGTTVIPDFTRCSPSTTIRSPGFRPSSMTTMLPSIGPTLTTLIVTLLSAPTTATWWLPCSSLIGPLRNEDRSLPEVDGDPDLGVLSGPQQVPRIRKRSRELDRAGLHVHLAADEERLPAVREDRAVRENELAAGPSRGSGRPCERLLDRAVLGDPVPGTPARSD